MKKLLLLLTIFFIASSSLVSADAGDKTEIIWQKERLDEEIKRVNTQYRSNLEAYRYKDKQYRISYDQHQTLQTLASIEDLVQKAKDLGISRDETLTDYLTLLKLNLISTEGIELTLKEKYLRNIDQVLVYLEEHKEELETLSNRDEVFLSLATFAETLGDLDKKTNEVLVLLSVGKLQMVFDKSEVLKEDIDEFLEKEDVLSKAEVTRASMETDRYISSTKTELTAFWEDLVVRSNKGKSLSSFYSSLSKDLDPIYIGLSQLLSYLGELLSL